LFVKYISAEYVKYITNTVVMCVIKQR